MSPKGANINMRQQEGFIPVIGEHRIWYRIVGGGAEVEAGFK